MTDRRRRTGTRTLQTVWTLVVLTAIGVLTLADLLPPLVTVGGGGVLWLLGLVGLGLRERRHWRRMTAASTFEPGFETHTSDLQQILDGQSVSVSTEVDGLLSQAHLTVRANVEGVDASFTVQISDAVSADRDGLTTGVDALDGRFAIRGKEANVAPLLSEDVRTALLAVETPGTFTVTAEEVRYEVPFTRLTTDELDAAGRAVARLAARLEALGQRKSSGATAEN